MTTSTSGPASVGEAVYEYLGSAEYAAVIPTDAEIGRRFGMTRARVQQLRQERGLPPWFEVRCGRGHLYAVSGTRPLPSAPQGFVCVVCSPDPVLLSLTVRCDWCGQDYTLTGDARLQYISHHRTHPAMRSACPGCTPTARGDGFRRWHAARNGQGG